MKKIYHDWQQIERWSKRIALDILKTDWRPDYIVGLTRGGLIPATIISHTLDVPMYTLKVALRDGDTECNAWMAEDAYGWIPSDNDLAKMVAKKNILIVDDINDTGATFEWIKKDWPASCLPKDPAWNNVWHGNVKFAVLVNNLASSESIDWCATDINKIEEPCWVVFPWEQDD